MPSSVEDVFWSEMAFFCFLSFVVALPVVFLIAPPLTVHKRIKAIMGILFLVVTGVPYGAFALGQGFDTRSDGHLVHWGRWIVNTICQFLVLGMITLSVTDSVKRAVGNGIVGALAFLLLIFGTESVAGAQIYWFAFAIGIAALHAIYYLFGIHAPRASEDCEGLPAWKVWLTKIATVVFVILAYPCVYVASSSYKDAFPSEWSEALVFLMMDVASRVLLGFFVYCFVDACVPDSVVGEVVGFFKHPGQSLANRFDGFEPINAQAPSVAPVSSSMAQANGTRKLML